MVQEGAGARFDILDVPLAVGAPELAMSPADHLRLETHRMCIGIAGVVVALAISPNPYNAMWCFECA